MKLYTPDLLALATRLAEFPLQGEYDRSAEVRSRVCGSTLALGVRLDSTEQISDLGMRVSACAVGQSAAAIFALAARGTTRESLIASLGAIDGWLAGDGKLPEWPGFAALAAAQPHVGRHEALRLPWRAGISALSSAPSPS